MEGLRWDTVAMLKLGGVGAHEVVEAREGVDRVEDQAEDEDGGTESARATERKASSPIRTPPPLLQDHARSQRGSQARKPNRNSIGSRLMAVSPP